MLLYPLNITKTFLILLEVEFDLQFYAPRHSAGNIETLTQTELLGAFHALSLKKAA